MREQAVVTITIYNTMTRRKEPLAPINPGSVTMFVCGPTVYDLSHVGHGKTYTQFDLVARYLRHSGYQVTYAQNITDVDDKIIRRAAEVGVEPRELAARYEREYLRDMAALGNDSIDVHPRAHDYIEQICHQVKALIARGHAYQLEDGWYFDLSTFPNYGKLSGRTEVRPEDAVSRVDENINKRNPGDFALWKARKPGEPYWESDLGAGRPGWHIEDTAITETLFGPQYDLHGGAIDLIFPHHEAEIAQMEAASGLSPLVRCWMHAGFLRVDGAKMGKSVGNFLTIRDALARLDSRVLRFAFLSQHYRSEMELNDATVENSAGALARIDNFVRSIDHSRQRDPDPGLLRETRQQFYEQLDDDFDTPAALATLFEHIRRQNRMDSPPGRQTYEFLTEVDAIFQVLLAVEEPVDPAIASKVAERQRLRSEKRYAEADAIRNELLAQGIVLEDAPTGVRWSRKKT